MRTSSSFALKSAARRSFHMYPFVARRFSEFAAPAEGSGGCNMGGSGTVPLAGMSPALSQDFFQATTGSGTYHRSMSTSRQMLQVFCGARVSAFVPFFHSAFNTVGTDTRT